MKGKLHIRAQTGNSRVGIAQAGTVFSGNEESQTGKIPKRPLGWNQQQHQPILVNFGQLLYWETEISTGNIDSQPVLWVLSSAFLLFPASGAEGAPQHPRASLGCPAAVGAGIQSLFLAGSQLCSPNASLEFWLGEFSVQGDESESKFSFLSQQWLPRVSHSCFNFVIF